MLTGGGYLPKILEAIVDAIPEGASPVAPDPTISVNAVDAINVDEETAAEQLGITVEELKSIPDQLVIKVGSYLFTRLSKQIVGANWHACFGTTPASGFEAGGGVYIEESEGRYSFQRYEI